MAELSVIIPARSEPYLQKTVDDLLTKIEGDTEILWEEDSGIGQRALQNKLVNKSTAKYILKTDAHVMFSKGFDVQMIKDMQDDMIMSPVMLPLDAENWRVEANLPVSWFGFDPNLITQIDKTRQNNELISESMCLHGSAWMITRENYWKWNICDETLGSWGFQAFELGYKAFMNGGKCVVNKNCYYAHAERKKESDFPYQRDMDKIKATRDEVIKRYKDDRLIPIIKKWDYPFGWNDQLLAELPKYEENTTRRK